MQRISYQELIDREELQRLQEEFCAVTGVLLYCLDAEGEELTVPSAPAEMLERQEQYLDGEMTGRVLDRVEEGSLEDLAIEELQENGGWIAAVAVRVEDVTAFCWVCACAPELTEQAQFYRVLDLLRDASYTLISNKMLCVSAEAESRRSRFEQQEMSRDLRTIESTTRIVQLLDSDEPIEAIIDQWLGILGKHLGVDTAEVFQIHEETEEVPRGDRQVPCEEGRNFRGEMDMICEWRNRGVVSCFDNTSGLPVPGFLRTLKPLAVSLDGGQNEYQDELEKLGLKAVMVFPILHQDGVGGMVLSLNHRNREGGFRTSEIKFTSDAVKLLQSILTRRIQKNSLAGSYAVLEAILDNVGCSIYVADQKTGEMLFANKSLQNTFAEELQKNTFLALVSKGMTEGQPSGMYEMFYAGMDCWYDLIYKEISWVDGRRATLFSLYDITDKKIYQRRIEQQAYTDFLTGLYNRMCCERDLARQIDEARRNGETGAILYLDLDDFKHINDGLGHQYGDVLLKAISGSLKKIDGIQSTCYRMGGDEFVIVIPPRYYHKFDKIIEDIRQIFSKPWYLKDADYYCTTSIGIVTFPDGGDSVTDLVKKADIAMYEAKKSGKNRVARYQDGNDSASGRRLDMEKNMRDATVSGYGEFEVYFQPIINVERGGRRCAGAEALLRWNSRKLGFIPPAEFIPLAEYLGLINPIGNYVLQEACTRCRQWNDNGYPDYRVNVNLSVVQLLQADIVESVERVLKETGIRPDNLTLEVTESLAINDMERMKEILNRIKTLGVKIALDDFGTGYSSLNHIREIPFDVIKVDQSFVRDLAEDAYSQSFIKMVAELGRTIGVSICVEGIETEAQYKVLRGMKVKYIQGYYFDRPMKREQFEAKYVKIRSGSA